MENKVVVGNELVYLKKELLHYVKKFCGSISRKEHFLIGNNTATALCWTDALRFFLDGLNKGSSPAKDLIISSAYQINKRCPLAVPLYFYNIIGDDIEVSNSPYRVASSDLISSLQNLDDDFLQENFDIFIDCLVEAGASGTITITPSNDSFKKLEMGFKTLCKIDSFFAPYLNSVDMDNCKIVLLSGAIIDVSEIHHILEDAYSTKQNIVIIASSFSQDVSNTLLVNWQKGNTNVFPFVIEDSIENVNEFRDIAELTNCFFATNENGLRLSNVDLKELQSYQVFFNSVDDELRILLDGDGTRRCFNLRKKLLEKYSKENIEDVRDIIGKRISRMSSRNVVLNLKIEESQKGLIEDKASAFFSYFSKCAQQGVVEVGNDYIVKYLPAHEALYAIRRAKQDLIAIDNIKALIRFEE